MGEPWNIDVPLRWKSVLVKGMHFDWHKHPPRNVRERDLISGPRIYRWLLRTTSGEIEFVYIGQSERFQERVSAYRNLDHRRVESDRAFQSRLKKYEDCGGTVELEFLDLDAESFCINGKAITNASLGDHDIRLMMESIAIVDARVRKLSILNQLHDNVHLKDLKRLVKQNPKVIEQILQKLRSEQA